MVRLIEDMWYWLSQGQNATILLLIVTATYVAVTYRMAKSVARQTTGMLQPVLDVTCNEDRGKGLIIIRNLGTHPVVLLDTRIVCYPHGLKPVVRIFEGDDEQIISAGANPSIIFSFEGLVPEQYLQGICGYELMVVASDLSRQVVVQYRVLPVLGSRTGTLGDAAASMAEVQFEVMEVAILQVYILEKPRCRVGEAQGRGNGTWARRLRQDYDTRPAKVICPSV